MVYDAIIVGAGPAGITTGIYLARANKKVAIIERFAFGGQVAEIGIIENYPGFTQISGCDLAMNMYKQAKKLGVEFVIDEVLGYDFDKDEKVVHTNSKDLYAKTIVLAIGSKPRSNPRKIDVYESGGSCKCGKCFLRRAFEYQTHHHLRRKGQKLCS